MGLLPGIGPIEFIVICVIAIPLCIAVVIGLWRIFVKFRK